MTYLTLAVPSNLSGVADKIAAAFEPDSSITPDTYKSFLTSCIGVEVEQSELNESPIQYSIPNEEYYCYGSEVKDWIADSTDTWKSNPEQLYGFVSNTYSERWPEHIKPTIDECKQFCENVLISKQYGILSGITELALKIKVE